LSWLVLVLAAGALIFALIVVLVVYLTTRPPGAGEG
jgi:hypothetical protein